MKKKYSFLKFSLYFTLIITFSLISCREKNETTQSLSPPFSKKSCELMNLGEASLAIEKKLPNNQYVKLEGMSDPRTLVWQEAATKKIYYITQILGTQGFLFYMEELVTGQTPKIKSTFTGTLLMWKYISPRLQKSIEYQFKEQWNKEINPEKTYIVQGSIKPEGCE